MRLRATTPCAKLGGHTKAKRSVLLRLGLLFVLCGVFVPASVHRLLVWPSPPPQSGNYEPNSTISTMIWAVHFGYDNYGQNNFHDLARKIRDANVQVVGLLETDLARPFNANWDVVEWLGEELNMYTNYGPPTMKNTWGVAMLSAYPILSANHSFLPSPNGELAAFIDAQILVQGKQVRVIVAHFGNHPDVYDRQLQTEEVCRMANENRQTVKQPMLFLGYLSDSPKSESFKAFIEAGWDDSAPRYRGRWCEYIFYMNLQLKKFRRVSREHVTDTEIQVANFEMLPPVETPPVEATPVAPAEDTQQPQAEPAKEPAHEL
eukprot:TRINITY_DN1299_c0_g1_i1.p2 TRINITY_DN1299_c0_g1~~TRINITY_DN1299_c0_g1_i1.p2  ORF type:complete len:319 (-),score=71.25 TRINITY_DN1299_c0_g1_i1:39-995(-)